tara:strand:+ start:302 stop:598 length:297 start_codon:yes stop_codon:yes gene_type:complete
MQKTFVDGGKERRSKGVFFAFGLGPKPSEDAGRVTFTITSRLEIRRRSVTTFEHFIETANERKLSLKFRRYGVWERHSPNLAIRYLKNGLTWAESRTK